MIQGHTAYYHEKGTGAFILVHADRVPAERVSREVGKVFKCRVYYEGTNSLHPNELVSEKYLKDNCVWWKAQFVPDGVKNMLKMGW